MVKRLFRLILNYINDDKLIVRRRVGGGFTIWYTIDVIRNGKYMGTQPCSPDRWNYTVGKMKQYWKIERVKYEN